MSNKHNYRVQGQAFDSLADARESAERIMAGLPDDLYVMIERRDLREQFYQPYKRIERERGRFVLR